MFERLKSKLKKFVAIGMSVGIMTAMCSVGASATVTINTTDGGTLGTWNSANTYTTVDEKGNVSQVSLFANTASNGAVTFNAADFEKMESAERERAMTDFANWINSESHGMTVESKQAILDEVRDASDEAANLMIPVIFEGSEADLFTAFKFFQPFAGPLGVVLGVGVIIIVVLLMASTVFDLVYIGVPVMRNYLTTKQEEKSGNAMAKPWGITNDAFSAINETEATLQNSDGKYKNAYVTYFKRRAFTYIILAICILYLMSGEIVGIISWLLNLVSGFGS
jgi:hypothetical protein